MGAHMTAKLAFTEASIRRAVQSARKAAPAAGTGQALCTHDQDSEGKPPRSCLLYTSDAADE